MADTTYNGWTNHETWATFLWATNEESTNRIFFRCKTVYSIKELVNEMIETAFARYATNPMTGFVHDLGSDGIPDDSDVRDILTERLDDWSSVPRLHYNEEYVTFVRGLLTTALEDINWQELLEAATEE